MRPLSSNGPKAWAQALHKGYKGIVGKDPASPTSADARSKWMKVKQPKYRGVKGKFCKP